MQKSCRQCQAPFEVTPDDLAYLEKISPIFAEKKELIPPSTLCQRCRQQRLMAWRNERTLYRRTCGLTGKPMISMYSADKPFPVYQQQAWWSDAWNPLTFGRSLSPSIPFFEQFHALLNTVPQMSLYNVLCEENCDYVNIEYDDRNCFMCFAGGYCEDCYYGTVMIRAKNCVDCLKINLCEQCYELSDSERCHRCCFSQDLHGCSDCRLCYDCQGCTDCFGCAGLRNKHHYYFNEQLTKEIYESTMSRMKTGSFTALQKQFLHLRRDILPKTIRKFAHLYQSEECTGDYIISSGDCENCFEVQECKDLKNVTLAEQLKDSRDCYITGWPAELCYECMSSCLNAYHNLFCNFCWNGCADLLFCDHCFSCKNCFGCVGLRHKQYCILNKQYGKEEYEQLVPRIISSMRKTEDWGDFFPVQLSPFAYNETIAEEQFPLTKDETAQRGWQWREERDEAPKVAKVIPAEKLPDAIDDVPDDIVHSAIECEVTKRPFKIIKQELEFYRTMRLPIPRFHPDERHKRRLALRNPRKLWNRKCAKCSKEIQTTYAPNRPEIVYCEACYLREVY